MSFFSRLEKLEEFWSDDGRMSEIEAQTELLRQFAKESPGNGATLDRSVAMAKSLNAVRLIRHPECGELRRALGDYCRKRRILFPGAKLIRVRRETCVLMFGGDGTLMQVKADLPWPEIQMENQQ